MRAIQLACALAFLVIAPAMAHAQPARDLAPPWRRSSPPTETTPTETTAPSTAPSIPTAPLSPVTPIGDPAAPTQDIHPAPAVRRFGDGHSADVPWADPELDLRPTGYVHGGLFGMGGLVTATSHTPLTPDLALGFLVDVALEPHLSLHLRLGFLVRARFAGTVVGADGLRGEQASLSGRGFALIGAHFFQVLALRIGFEVGASTALGAPRASSGVGYAAVMQLGVRLDDGHIEIVIDGAIDSHEGVFSRIDGSEARFAEQPGPRLMLGLIGEFG